MDARISYATQRPFDGKTRQPSEIARWYPTLKLIYHFLIGRGLITSDKINSLCKPDCKNKMKLPKEYFVVTQILY